MAQYYVASGNTQIEISPGVFVSPSDSFDGLSPSTPKATLANLLSTYPSLTNADTINIAGIHVGTFDTDANCVQWSGQSQGYICGSIDISTGGGWSFTTNTWRKTIGPGVTLGQNATTLGTVTGVSGTNPAVITTSAAHGLSNGRYVTLAGLSVTPGTINGVHLVTVTGATTFSVPVDASGTTPDVNGTWNSDYGNVCAGWLSRVDGSSRHYGWYPTIQSAGGTNVANVLSVDQSYDCDGTTIWFRDDTLCPSGTNPSTLSDLNAVRYVPGGVSRIGLNVQQSGAVAVTGLVFLHYCTRVGVSYGLIGGGQCTLTSCTGYDNGDHSFLFSANPNTACIANNCTVWGSDIITSAGFTWHNPVAGASADVTGGRAFDCIVYAYPLLGPSGLELDNAQTDFSVRTNVSGFFAHPSPGGGSIDDLQFFRCFTRFFSNPGNNIDANVVGALSGAVHLSSSYPIVATDCYSVNAKTFSVSANMFFLRCDLGCSGQVSGTLEQITILGTASVAFESCVLPGNLTPTAAEGRILMRLNTGAQVTFVNSDLHVVNGGANFQLMFAFTDAGHGYVAGSAGWRINAYGSNFTCTTAGVVILMAFDDNAPTTNYNFIGNNYHNFSQWSDNDLFNGSGGSDTFAEWRNGTLGVGGVDTTALNVDPGYSSPNSLTRGVAGFLSSSSALLLTANKLNTSVHTTRGINGNPWNMVVGAFQDLSLEGVNSVMGMRGGMGGRKRVRVR